VDLHGLRPDDAMRRLEQELHTARVRGAAWLEVITGAGHGNRRGEPVLRTRVEAWLRSEAARARGVRGFQRIARGGALEVRLRSPADDRRAPRGPEAERPPPGPSPCSPSVPPGRTGSLARPGLRPAPIAMIRRS
jgi:hypothetical protein